MDTATRPETERSQMNNLKQGDSAVYHIAMRQYSPGMSAVSRFYLDHSVANALCRIDARVSEARSATQSGKSNDE